MQTTNREMLHTNEVIGGPSTEPLYLETDFFPLADVLREQFEQRILSTAADGSASPFCYAFNENRYQFLTASAERVFAAPPLQKLLATLKAWAARRLAASHVSTPQARMYLNGCSRELLRDEVAFGWHYALSLTRNRPYKAARIKVVVESGTDDAVRNFEVSRVVSFQLKFNQLLVHRSSGAYRIETGKTSMNPLESDIFLDGYFW